MIWTWTRINLCNEVWAYDVTGPAICLNSMSQWTINIWHDEEFCLFDPSGFLSAVIVCGKLILKDVVSENSNWDEPLPEHILATWRTWSSNLKTLEEIHIPRVTVPLSTAVRKELWIYSDSSKKAIVAVSYPKVFYKDGSARTWFVLGKARVAPASGHTKPRLELCAAVLAIDISQIAIKHMDMTFDSVKYLTDSRVVLGYIHNDKRQVFFVCIKQSRQNSKFQRAGAVEICTDTPQPCWWRYKRSASQGY